MTSRRPVYPGNFACYATIALLKKSDVVVPILIKEEGVKTRGRIKISLGYLLICFCAFSLCTKSTLAQAKNEYDLRAAVVEQFMAARTFEYDVEARKLMTASLEDDYLHNKRLSIRVRSGRVVSFNFDASKITPSGDKAFTADVESFWADLNEMLFATQNERIKFILVKDQWLADGIKFMKSVPRPRLLPFNLVSEKRGKLALSVVKKLMKAVINRDPKIALQVLTQEFQSKFQSQDELEKFLFGSADPSYAAYEVNTLTQKDTKEMEVRVKLFRVVKGKRGITSQDVRLTVREGKSDWNIDDFELVSG